MTTLKHMRLYIEWDTLHILTEQSVGSSANLKTKSSSFWLQPSAHYCTKHRVGSEHAASSAPLTSPILTATQTWMSYFSICYLTSRWRWFNVGNPLCFWCLRLSVRADAKVKRMMLVLSLNAPLGPDFVELQLVRSERSSSSKQLLLTPFSHHHSDPF